MLRTFKFILATLFLVLTLSAHALEVKGVKVDETAQVSGNALVLNGAGIRTKMVFKVYVGALYLTQKQTDANAVISDTGAKRVSLHFLRQLNTDAVLIGMNEGFSDNNDAAQMAAIEPQMKAFRQIMTAEKEVKEGDLIVLDLSSAGTQVNVNGKMLGKIEGAAFNQALLRVWLGAKPVDADLKQAMLGKAMTGK
ncbi:MAG: chalcone isomerase family protein [Bdellovibrio sp.]|nr:chalcone isomerase family protein [Methylotenera sp.]